MKTTIATIIVFGCYGFWLSSHDFTVDTGDYWIGMVFAMLFFLLGAFMFIEKQFNGH